MLRKIAAGVVIGVGVFGLLVGLAARGVQARRAPGATPAWGAPDDPGMATLNDAIDVIERVRACHREAVDGGP